MAWWLQVLNPFRNLILLSWFSPQYSIKPYHDYNRTNQTAKSSSQIFITNQMLNFDIHLNEYFSLISSIQILPSKTEIICKKDCTHENGENDSHRFEHSTKQRTCFKDAPCA